MNQVVITGYQIDCVGTQNIKSLKSSLATRQSKLKELEMFEKLKFSSKMGGLLEPDFREDIIKESQETNCDEAVTLAKSSIRKLIEFSGLLEEEVKNAHILIGTCNANINSLEKYLEGYDPKFLKMYNTSEFESRINAEFNLSNDVLVFNNACSASGSAIAVGYEMIVSGEASLVLAGGVDWMSKYVYAGFNSLGAMSSKKTSPYSQEIGLNLGEGCAFICIESYDSAIARGATILGEISGYGLSNDGYHKTTPHPLGNGIKNAINSALDKAELNIDQIDYINTHGTGTKANDATELNAIRTVFGNRLPKISSYKGYVGHNLGAAAVIELVITLIGFEEGVFYAAPIIEKFREGCENSNVLEQHFQFNKSKKQNVLVLNSAFGGHNSALVISNKVSQKCSKPRENKIKLIAVNNTSNTYSQTNIKGTNKKIKLEQTHNFLKSYNSNLYARRMNRLTQQSLVSINEILQDVDLENKNIAFVFGTDFGSIDSIEKYVSSIETNGIENASSIYFPDIVMNSIAGVVCRVFQFTGYCLSITCRNINKQASLANLVGKNTECDIVINCHASYSQQLKIGTNDNSNSKVVTELYQVLREK